MNEAECWDLLLGASLGRLAVSVHDTPEIFPVNFLAYDKKIMIRTAPGEKLLQLTINGSVALETDGRSNSSAWSVVVKGQARQLQSGAEIEMAEKLALRPWTSSVKSAFVEIVPSQVTGRRLHTGPELERTDLSG
ncbi:MAG: pyridoxamine 5'-phosphate oxidase family protein [Actinomycetota bacterium]|nr:pyridoxamine 5'-phosphate oxidase family protein [Actinomycetota bacterium]